MKRTNRWRIAATSVTLAAVVMLVAAGCTAGGPVTYNEAEELRAQIADMEERLSEVEGMLGDVQSADLPSDAEQTIGDAANEVSAVLTSLEDIHAALETPQLNTEVPPPQPAPGGAGGTSM